MKRALPVVLAAAAIAGATPAAAQEADDLDRFALGAYASAGMAHSFRELYGRDEDTTPRFAGGGGVCVTGDAGDSWNGPEGVPPLSPLSGGTDAFVLELAE